MPERPKIQVIFSNKNFPLQSSEGHQDQQGLNIEKRDFNNK